MTKKNKCNYSKCNAEAVTTGGKYDLNMCEEHQAQANGLLAQQFEEAKYSRRSIWHWDTDEAVITDVEQVENQAEEEYEYSYYDEDGNIMDDEMVAELVAAGELVIC